VNQLPLFALAAQRECNGEIIAHQMARRPAFSMSRKGNYFDNGAIESFFGTLKAEYFHLAAPYSLNALEEGVDDYVRYYNHQSMKLRLKEPNPMGYRLRNTAKLAAWKPSNFRGEVQTRGG
jgi:transposase InsO family protein